MTFQDLILKLSAFWASQGCLLQQPLDLEVGAGTSHPETLFRVLGPKPWSVAYVQPSRRPDDGRFGQNPNRLFKHHQFQVILKPSPDEVQQTYLDSLEACGINPRQHDIRFEEDNWESPTLGAWGIGWQVLLDGTEITQFTYFQQVGGLDLEPISCEITYGLERIAMFLQRVDNVFDLEWGGGVRYREVRLQEEIEQSKYAFGQVQMPAADFAALHRDLFDKTFAFAGTLLDSGLIMPALEHCLKCSHLFNILDSSGSVGVTERTAYILRIRQLAVKIVRAQVDATAADERWPRAPDLMDRELLIEIGCEEIPASWLPGLTTQVGTHLEARLKELRLTPEAPIETFSTPRRLTARVARLSERQTDFEELVTGPPVSAAFKPDGEATPAATGFAKKYGVEVAALERHETPKGVYLGLPRPPAGQGHRGRAGRRDDRHPPRHDVPEADALGRVPRGWQGRAGVRAADPVAGAHVWRPRGAVRDPPAGNRAGPHGAGHPLGLEHLRAPLSHHQRPRRPGHQGQDVRRLQGAAARELRHPRAQRARVADQARARDARTQAGRAGQPAGHVAVVAAGRRCPISSSTRRSWRGTFRWSSSSCPRKC